MLASVDPASSPTFGDLVAPLPAPIQVMTSDLVELFTRHPGVTGQVRTGWRSINFRHELAGYFGAIFPNEERVIVYFEYGRLLSDPDGLLDGGPDLKRGRFMRLSPEAPMPEAAILQMLGEAIALKA